MTDRDTDERLLDLIRQADRLRLPGHRHTADHCLEGIDELRAGIRSLYRERTGRDPVQHVPRSFSPPTMASARVLRRA